MTQNGRRDDVTDTRREEEPISLLERYLCGRVAHEAAIVGRVGRHLRLLLRGLRVGRNLSRHADRGGCSRLGPVWRRHISRRQHEQSRQRSWCERQLEADCSDGSGGGASSVTERQVRYKYRGLTPMLWSSW